MQGSVRPCNRVTNFDTGSCDFFSKKENGGQTGNDRVISHDRNWALVRDIGVLCLPLLRFSFKTSRPLCPFLVIRSVRFIDASFSDIHASLRAP